MSVHPVGAPERDEPSEQPLHRWRFGSAEFDEARSELRVGGLLVDVQPKPLQLLARLLAAPGEVVPKDQLLDALWGAKATGDAVLANAASKLRSALGEENAARVVTVQRQGYRFDGPVERMLSGRRTAPALELRAGSAVTGRPGYRLHERLSRPGAREVWRAVQPRTGDRRVFKFAADGEQLADLKREVTVQRVLFEQLGERADIARVIDWNFDDPPCWLECEDGGQSLEQWAAGGALQALTLDQRLALFLRMADAVAAAHGAGVLHRNLKPGNVLIDTGLTPLGDPPPAAVPQVRLADFGSARVLDAARLERLRITRLGLTVDGDDGPSGTPYYLAPELLAGQPPSLASDVYALGVMLVQLVAGDLLRPMAPGWERDVPDPLLRGDIAAATDLDPMRRPPSAAALAGALRALPGRRAEAAAAAARAEAAAAAAAELARARARRPWVAAALASLALGLGSTSWMLVDQRRSAQAVAREAAATEALNRMLREDLVAAANPGAGGRADITVAEALRGAAARVDRKYAELAPALRGRLHAALQQSLAELSQSREAVDAGRRAVAALASAAPLEHAALQNARLRLAVDLVQVSELAEAAAVVRDIEAAPLPAGSDADVFRARLLFAKSWLTAGEFALQQSLEQLQQAAALVEPLDERRAPGRGAILFGLADGYSLVGRHGEAEAVYRRLLAEQTVALGADHARTLYTQVGLARVLGQQGRDVDARPLLQAAAAGLSARLGADHRHTLTARDQLADLLDRAGEHRAAADEWGAVQQGYTKLMGAGSSHTLTVQTNRASALRRAGAADEAVVLLRDALERARRLGGDELPQIQQIRYALADGLLQLDRRAEAAALARGLEPQALNLAQQEKDWPQRLARLQARIDGR